jgi:basic amino acid/polyamine antiporter, APA family
MTQLKRSLGLSQATAMVVGTIIGASIFVQASEITRLVPSITGVFLVWAAAGVLTFFGALACAELASAFPQTGGVYTFLKETYSPEIGFLWGWAMFWSMHSGIIAAIAMVFARYVGYFVPLSDLSLRLVAIGAILLLSGINYVGVKHASTLQTLFTLGKVLAIVAIILLIAALGLPTAMTSAPQAADQISLSSFAQAVAAGLFAFGGWHMVTYTAEETRSPKRTIPVALMIGTLTVTVCYIALNGAYLHVLPLEQVMSSTRVAADAGEGQHLQDGTLT